MKIKHIIISILLSTLIQASDNLKIGGSSTLFLFSSTVSSIVGVMKDEQLPIVQSTGSSKGIKQLCSTSTNSLDIVNASRRIKEKEVLLCKQNGIKDITELYVGRNGIVFVQSNQANAFPNITRKELFLALAKEVPNKEGKLQKNSYTTWNQINPKLPKRKILVYGHKKTAGIRASFNAIVIKHISNKSKDISPYYKNSGYKNYISLREDGAFIELDSDKEILEKTLENKDAIGNLNYLYYSKNRKKSKAISIDGVSPSNKNIENSSYKLAKKLYIYYRQSNKNTKDSLTQYLKAFLSDEAIGENGILKEIGFVPLSKKQRDITRNIYKKNILLKLK